MIRSRASRTASPMRRPLYESPHAFWVPLVHIARRQNIYHLFLRERDGGVLLNSGTLYLDGPVSLDPLVIRCEAEKGTQPLEFFHNRIALISPRLAESPHQFEVFPP